MEADARYSRWLWIILLIGLLLRLVYAMDQPTLSAFEDTGGGDSGWFLAVGWGFFSGQEHGWIRQIPFTNAQIPTPPVYIVFAGMFQRFLSDHATVVTMRLLQCLSSVATAYLVFRIGALLGGQRAGLVGAFLAAFHPALIFEPANIATETLYLFFLACGLWLYVEYVVDALCRQKVYRLKPGVAVVLTAIALSLATLTRAVSVLFPLGIALHLLLLGRRHLISNWRGKAMLLLAVYAIIVSSWTVYNLVLWDRFVLASDRLLATIWRGFESNDGSPQQNDALLLEGVDVGIPEGCEVDCKYHHPDEVYIQKIRGIIDANPTGLVALRINELAFSLVQPHGTTGLGDVSIRQAAGAWLSENRSLDGLIKLMQIDGFAIKLVMWSFHLSGIGFALLGMILSRKLWHLSLPLIGFMLYTVVAHLFLLALPRYMFALEIVWQIFSGVAVVMLYDRWRMRSGSDAVSLVPISTRQAPTQNGSGEYVN